MRDFQLLRQKNPHVALTRISVARRFAFRIGCVVLLVIVYMFATMPPLRIQRVVVHAATEEGRGALSHAVNDFLNARSFWIFPNRSIPFFKARSLTSAIEHTLPVETLSLRTKFRDRELDVTATFRVPAARIQLPTSTLYVDAAGRPLRLLLEPYNESRLLEIRSSGTGPTSALALSGDDIEVYQTLKMYFAKRSTPILWMIMPEDPDSITFQMRSDWKLFIARHERAPILTKRFDIFFRQRQNAVHPKPLEYIDLRFGDKVVYKEKV